jgi:acyl-CoA dehydrogenase
MSAATEAAIPPGIGFVVEPELAELVARVRSYVHEDVLPLEATLDHPEALDEHWPVVETLRDRARELGIFTPHLPQEWGGLGVGVLGMSLISQECGISAYASLGLNAMAPDEGNMHTLLSAGTPEQQAEFLAPLAAGRTRSCFAMTEPDVASSDPTNLRTTAVRDGDAWVLNGRKWFITGGVGAAFAIVVAKTGSEGIGHRNYSLILVPTDTPGWRVIRDPGLIGAHYAGGHPEIELRDVRVPLANLLGAEGEGFVIAQKRLAGGRLAHAMRWIGVAQAALDRATEHLLTREAFGKRLADHQALQTYLADSAMDLYASRLMVLHTAWKVESGLPHRQEVAMTKTFVAEAFGRVVDRAVQIFGSHGVTTDDHPIAQWYADARAARIYDGTSEVHRMTIARGLVRLAEQQRSTAEACGALT